MVNQNIFLNKLLISVIIIDIFAQLVKPLFHFLKTKKWDFTLLFGNGGFPSSHSAAVTALSTRIAMEYGMASSLFSIAAVFSSIVIFDATGVRQEVGKHSKTLNDLLYILKMKEQIGFIDLEELIGHSFFEVMGGIFLGIIGSFLLLLIPYFHL
jgi:acid phosphatase family membrane protein YuiD